MNRSLFFCLSFLLILTLPVLSNANKDSAETELQEDKQSDYINEAAGFIGV